MKWNQQTIHQWGIDTFGDAARDSLGLAIRMAKEGVELAYQLRLEDELVEIKDEAADVAIVTLQVANSLGFNVAEILDEETVSEDAARFQRIFQMEDDALDDVGLCAEMFNSYIVKLISALFHGEVEAAKTVIVQIFAALGVVEEIFEFDLNEQIQTKMEINAARKWAKLEDGSFQHV